MSEEDEFMMVLRGVAWQCLILLALCSCAVGPDYRKPDETGIVPADWRWKTAEPKDTIPKGEWWRVFHDPVLNGLETNAVADNQNLSAAVARVDGARAAARISRSQFFPEISLDPSFKRERTTGNLPTPIPFHVPSAYISTFSVPFDLSYEVDLWGRVRRSFEASHAQAAASVADYQNVLLTLTAGVAVNYFMVRSLDLEIAVLQRTVELRDASVGILEKRFEVGTISEIDVAQAKTELATAKADLADTGRQRAETFNALALLCGKAPGSFEIAESRTAAAPATVPAGLPSSLLERRPDIAGAERSLAAKNAQIGVARAAYFPALRLTGQAGYLSADVDKLFSSDSRVWSIGPSVSFPLFNAGRTASEVEQAEASYREALAQYRQTVLTAFREVEDALAQIVFLSEQAAAQTEALAASRRATELAGARYEAGSVSHLEVMDAERTMLQQELKQTQLDGQRYTASVHLIKSLGGGWEAGAQP
jgi:outer membrane protein, multidrug efflux system